MVEAVLRVCSGGVDVVFDVVSATYDPALLSGISPAGRTGSLTLTWPTLNDHNAGAEVRRWRAAEVFGAIAAGVLRVPVDTSLALADT